MIMVATWAILFGLIVASSFTQVPLWLPILLYIASVMARARQKLGDYKDWQRISERDEKSKLNEVAENMAAKGLTFSGLREKAERQVKEDFQFERNKAKRKLWVDLFETLFLK